MTRYHSLIVERASLPDSLTITAETSPPASGDGLIMGLQHKTHPVHGVQFHPESIASEHGHALLANFLEIAGISPRRRNVRAASRPKRRARERPMDAQPSQELRALIQKVSGGATLTEDEIRTALDQMTAGAATPAQMGAFLMALRVRGETVEEITGAAQMLRSRMNRVEVPPDAVDIVGTGGDSHGTYNVSTCAALVAAGAGVKIAKHGNRRVSSKSGASDVLAELGVKLDVPFDTISRCVAEAGPRLPVGAAAPSGHEALGGRSAASSASAPSSTCWGRSPIPAASSARWWACSPGTGWSRSPTCSRTSAPSTCGWCTATTASTS